jgi:hypothetical protein
MRGVRLAAEALAADSFRCASHEIRDRLKPSMKRLLSVA